MIKGSGDNLTQARYDRATTDGARIGALLPRSRVFHLLLSPAQDIKNARRRDLLDR